MNLLLTILALLAPPIDPAALPQTPRLADNAVPVDDRGSWANNGVPVPQSPRLSTLPVLPASVSASVPLPPTESVTLTWTGSGPGELWYAPLNEEPRRVPVTQNRITVNLLTNAVWYFGIVRESEKLDVSNVLQLRIPPRPVTDVIARVDGNDSVIVSYTNTPPGGVGLFIKRERKDYAP